MRRHSALAPHGHARARFGRRRQRPGARWPRGPAHGQWRPRGRAPRIWTSCLAISSPAGRFARSSTPIGTRNTPDRTKRSAAAGRRSWPTSTPGITGQRDLRRLAESDVETAPGRCTADEDVLHDRQDDARRGANRDTATSGRRTPTATSTSSSSRERARGRRRMTVARPHRRLYERRLAAAVWPRRRRRWRPGQCRHTCRAGRRSVADAGRSAGAAGHADRVAIA